jgi:hypothetical protein
LKLRKTGFIGVIGAALVLTIGTPAAFAIKPAGNVIRGTLTAPSNGDTLSVDGHQYRIKAGSPAVEAIRRVPKGTVVDVLLNGPPNTSASEVIGVVQRTTR